MTAAFASNAEKLLARLEAAYRNRDAIAQRFVSAGRAVVRYTGVDFPREIFLAGGVLPIQLCGDARLTSKLLRGLPNLGARGRALVVRMAEEITGEAFALTHADSELVQLFANLRELGPQVPLATIWVEMIDLLHLPHETSLEYNHGRLLQLANRLLVLTSTRVTAARLHAAFALCNEQKRQLEKLNAARVAGRITGTQMLMAIGAATVMPPEEHLSVLRELLGCVDARPASSAPRVFVSGSSHDDIKLYSLLEGLGVLIVGEDHDTGQRWYGQLVDELSDPWFALAQPTLRVPLAMRPMHGAGLALLRSIETSTAQAVVHIARQGDEAAEWEATQCERHCAAAGIRCLRLKIALDESMDRVRERLAEFFSGERRASVPLATDTVRARRETIREQSPPGGARSQKSLASVSAFASYQKAWFARVRERAADGEPFAVANANAPQEILRAFDVPFVVNQWWASIVAAKQQSKRYLDLLRERGYPVTAEAYSAQGLAACFDADAEHQPWGGLPKPSLLVAVASTDATLKIFDAWAQTSGAHLEMFERSVECRKQIALRWWDRLPTEWDRVIEPERLDLMEAELCGHIARLEGRLGRHFPHERFREVMDLVNEQEEWYRRTRGLIAQCAMAPVSIVDTMPATMVPQWHRGTTWGRDAARTFHDDVAARVASGESVCPNERIRLMWVGRGMWSEMGFYQRWERSHGAVFVWSMYLALAADGYVRTFDNGRDPLRALAARFVTMGDELRMPTWGGAWHVHEAQTHRIDGAVALADADPFILRALRAAGVPVLELAIDNFSAGRASEGTQQIVTAFIEGPARTCAELRGRSASR